MSLGRSTLLRSVRVAAVAGAATLAALWATAFDRLRPALVGDVRVPLGPSALAALFALHAVVAALVLAAGVVLVAVADAAARGLPRWPRLARWLVALVAALCLAPLVHRLAVLSTLGSWIAAQSWVGALRAGLAAGGALVVLLFCRLVVGLRPVAELGALRRALEPVAWLLLAAAISTADTVILPGLYPAGHAALWASGVVLALLGAARAAGAVRHALPRAGTAVLCALGLCLVAVPALWPRSAWRRANLVLASPVAARMLRVDARSMPEGLLPKVLAAASRPRPRPASAAAAHRLPALDNIVLIVVDTLRGDAVPPGRTPASYSTRRGDTPFLNGWLDGLVRFRWAYAQAGRTRASMPHLFRSLEPSEDAERLGIPLAERMAALGRTPIAVVPPYFLMPREPEATHLLDGFAAVEVYRQDRQEDEVDQVRRILAAHRGRALFFWIHVYGVHWPYYAGSPPPDPAPVSLPQKYRASVRWLDGQLREIVAAIDAACPPERTAIVLASDHGERLGAGGVGHGTTVREADVRVPLALRLPGEPGRIVERVVGNIDIVPTLVELAGGEPDPVLRGRSLLDVLADPRGAESRSYLVATGNLTAWGLVREREKLLFAPENGALYRYDLRRDPRERKNLFGYDTDRDAELLGEMILRNPALARDELAEPENRTLLTRALAAVRPAAPPPAIFLLVRLAAQSEAPEHLAALERILRETPDPAVGATIVATIGRTRRREWGRLLEGKLAALSDEQTQRWVDALAPLQPPPFGEAAMQTRLARIVERRPPREWLSWLRLVTTWRGRATVWAPLLDRMLEKLTAGPGAPDVTTLVPVLGAITACTGWRGGRGLPVTLPDRVAPLVEHPDGRVGAAACRALAALGAEDEAGRVEARLGDARADPRTRQAAMHALAALRGEAAVEAIARAGQEPVLSLDAVRALGRLRSDAALPFLRDIAAHHANQYTRHEAERLLARIGEQRPRGARVPRPTVPPPRP